MIAIFFVEKSIWLR